MDAPSAATKAGGNLEIPAGERLDDELEFWWRECGQTSTSYDLYVERISKNPVVRSHATGKYFTLPWSLIIQLAVAKGIDAR